MIAFPETDAAYNVPPGGSHQRLLPAPQSETALDKVREVIRSQPAIALATAAVVGLSVGFWIKR
ncbi:hypothetical protein [Botrimarina sp.]|uniref:hypothetical protein n=1 Tax=Botrimarina sp. TaxID=2795802 RepID=UPI0032EC894F